MAIENCYIHNNTSIMQDEVLAHRVIFLFLFCTSDLNMLY